jgi:hypothetical protein
MIRVRFESQTPVFKWVRSVKALDSVVTVIEALLLPLGTTNKKTNTLSFEKYLIPLIYYAD